MELCNPERVSGAVQNAEYDPANFSPIICAEINCAGSGADEMKGVT